MALGARIKLARQARGWTQQQLADAIGWEQGAIGNAERRDSRSCSYTTAIADALNVDYKWLSTGIGAMETSGNEASIVSPPSKEGMTLIPRFSDIALSAGAGTCPPDFEQADGYTYMNTDRIRAVGADPECVIEARVDGNSMEPTIYDKSLIKIDTSKAMEGIKDGKIYAFYINDELKVKRLFKTASGSLLIRSDNKDIYKDEFLPLDEFLSSAKIIGWVFDWPPNERW